MKTDKLKYATIKRYKVGGIVTFNPNTTNPNTVNKVTSEPDYQLQEKEYRDKFSEKAEYLTTNNVDFTMIRLMKFHQLLIQ
jgi:hypothetical protein